MNEKTIVMIKRSQLQPHPDNPRKDLGDLTELRESIKENGLMQNLTVVPCGDGLVDSGDYMILIGHRRFAASEGILDELPCVIASNLSNKEQVGIMLCENMQRSDLTYLEQAKGFQLMLDLGDTVESISKKTGFSKTTVKHRLAINELDLEALKKASEWFQPTISDFIELEKVKDLEKRNEILEDATSSKDIEDLVREYLEDIEKQETIAKYKELFQELGWKEYKGYFNYGTEWKAVEGLGYIRPNKYSNDFAERCKDIAEKVKGEVYFSCKYQLSFAIKIPKKKEEKKKKTKAELIEEEKKKKANDLEHIRTIICDEYIDFILKIPEDTFKKFEAADHVRMLERCFKIFEELRQTIGLVQVYNLKTNDKEQIQQLQDKYNGMEFMRRIFINVWECLASTYSNKFINYNHIKNENVLDAHMAFYSCLYFFGFRLKEELRDVIEGDSDLYLIDGKEVKP